MAASTEYVEPVWDDANDMPLSHGDERKTRIAALLRALAAMRPCRRHGDRALLTQLQAELILLLDADLIRVQQKMGLPS